MRPFQHGHESRARQADPAACVDARLRPRTEGERAAGSHTARSTANGRPARATAALSKSTATAPTVRCRVRFCSRARQQLAAAIQRCRSTPSAPAGRATRRPWSHFSSPAMTVSGTTRSPATSFGSRPPHRPKLTSDGRAAGRRGARPRQLPRPARRRRRFRRCRGKAAGDARFGREADDDADQKRAPIRRLGTDAQADPDHKRALSRKRARGRSGFAAAP